jgi:hypothetical protein
MTRADGDDAGAAGIVGVRPLAATRLWGPPPACGEEWRN